jgi:hypothetical protein
MFSIPVSLYSLNEQSDTDISVEISKEDRARVMQENRQASKAPSGRDLAAMLSVTDKESIDSWNLSRHQNSTFRRLSKADKVHLGGVVKRLLSYRGLQHGGGGNWSPILEMHCYEVRDDNWIYWKLMLI